MEAGCPHPAGYSVRTRRPLGGGTAPPLFSYDSGACSSQKFRGRDASPKRPDASQRRPSPVIARIHSLALAAAFVGALTRTPAPRNAAQETSDTSRLPP